MKRSEMNGQAAKRQWQKMSGGWLLAVVCLLFASSCRAPAPETGRYQWVIVPQGEGRQDQICVSDTVTGEVAVWDGSSWSPSYMAPLSTPDWNDIRKQRERNTKRAEREKKLQEEAREKREAFVKSFSQMSLEKQVAWAKSIRIVRIHRRVCLGTPEIFPASFSLEILEDLKGEKNLAKRDARPYNKEAVDDLVVWFNGMADGGSLELGLSHKEFDKERVFPAPAMIIDDVKAEIKRQEEKQKEVHAENH